MNKDTYIYIDIIIYAKGRSRGGGYHIYTYNIYIYIYYIHILNFEDPPPFNILLGHFSLKIRAFFFCEPTGSAPPLWRRSDPTRHSGGVDESYHDIWLGGGNSNIFGIFIPKIGEDFHFDEL